MAATTPPRSKRYTPPAAARARSTAPRAAPAVPVAAVRAPAGGRQASGAVRAVPVPVSVAAVRAPVGRRLVAALLDLTLVPVAVLAGAEVAWRAGALGLLGVSSAGWDAWSWSFGRVAWTVAAAALAYHALCTARWGRTPGKRVVGLRVEMTAGGPVGLWRALWRGMWGAAVYLPSVLAPVLVVVGWMAVATGERRSPADRAAGTRVVRSVAS